MGAELFRANRRTDRHEEANSRLSQSFGMRLKIAERLLSRFQASYIYSEGNTCRRIEIILCTFGFIWMDHIWVHLAGPHFGASGWTGPKNRS